jgi:hypothetical protein
MTRKIEKVYSGGKLVKIVVSGKEKAEKALEKTITLGKEEAIEIFTKIPTITKRKALALYNGGIKSLQELALASTERLLAIKDITLKNAKAIKEELKGLAEELTRKPTAEKKEPGVTTFLTRLSKGSLSFAKRSLETIKLKIKSSYEKLVAPPPPPTTKKRAPPKKKRPAAPRTKKK